MTNPRNVIPSFIISTGGVRIRIESIKISVYADEAIKAGKIEPLSTSLPNGGPMSWYNYPHSENQAWEKMFLSTNCSPTLTKPTAPSAGPKAVG